MVKSSLSAFPSEGFDVHVSVDEALAHGISPGDPAVIEATVRPCTVEEWIAQGNARTFDTSEEEAEYYGRIPVPGSEPVPIVAPTADPEAAGDDDVEPTTIRWRSGLAPA